MTQTCILYAPSENYGINLKYCEPVLTAAKYRRRESLRASIKQSNKKIRGKNVTNLFNTSTANISSGNFEHVIPSYEGGSQFKVDLFCATFSSHVALLLWVFLHQKPTRLILFFLSSDIELINHHLRCWVGVYILNLAK